MSLAPNTPALENQKMNQDAFAQLYQSLSPLMATPAQDTQSVFEEWLKQDYVSEYSANSSPEINTPLDQFLLSPPFQSKDDNKSAFLFQTDSPQTEPSVLATPVVQPESCVSPAVTPIVSMPNLFADISDSLPAALAALAAVAAAPVNGPPAVTTPTFSNRRKRKDAMDPCEEAAIKRQKNTDAARRSRLRKVQKMETLEVRVAELEKVNANLQMRVAVLDSEKANLKSKEVSYENRIKVLEEQLAEAHKALSSRT